jgi:hypothetical protein
MGSGIACHFANIGVEVYFSISFLENLLRQTKKGLTLDSCSQSIGE